MRMTSVDAPHHTTTPRRRLGRAMVWAGVVAAVFLTVAVLVRGQWRPLLDLDERLIGAATDLVRPYPGVVDGLLLWQELTQPLTLHLVGALVCLLVWLRAGLRTRAWWAFATLMVTWVLGLLTKAAVQRARPVLEQPLEQAPGYSFPSGHALNAAAWASVLVILCWPLLRSRGARVATVTAAALFVLATCADRVLLGVHYPTDVTVGLLTGVGLTLASYAGYVGWNPPVPHPHADRDRPDPPAHHTSETR